MKRFTETTKWDDPWFIRLPVTQKLLWMYICDRCDSSGVIDFCPELASVQIGSSFTDDYLTEFGDRVRKLPSGKWQIIKFLSFQYGTVDANCPAHKPVIRMIQSNGLKYPINNLPSRVSNTLKETDKDKDKDKDKKGESEGDWLEQLKRSEAYKGIDVQIEYSKMCQWCSVNRQTPTRRRFVNWLNRVDKPLLPPLESKPLPKRLDPLPPDLTPEQIENNRKFAAEMVRKVKDGLRKTSSSS